MVIAAAQVVLRLAENESLKGKRQVVKSLLARLRNTFGVAAAEVDTLDSWHTATLGIAVVSNDAQHGDEVLGKLAPHNHKLAVELAGVPEHIRGFGHVKERHVKDAKARETVLLGEFRAAQAPAAAVKVAA